MDEVICGNMNIVTWPLRAVKLGRSRKDPHSPHGGNFCPPEGEGRKNVSYNSKCIRTSDVGRGVNFLFRSWV
jgi:hypothetical protein